MMMKKNAEGRSDRLQAFQERISASARDLSESQRTLLATFLNEAHVGLSLIQDRLDGASRILEVGSGIGALAGFLAEEGFDVTGIEPSALGFSAMEQLGNFVGQQLNPGVRLQVIRIDAADIARMNFGHFDLIFSVHVLEHVARLDEAMAALTQVLAPGGTMLHLCPNYRVPYEPHFGVPILVGSPALTRRAFASRINKQDDLWNSLNFVTENRLRNLAQANGLSFALRKGVMTGFLRRLKEDSLFRGRHKGLVGLAGWLLSSGPLLRLLDLVPPSWATPMVADIRRR